MSASSVLTLIAPQYVGDPRITSALNLATALIDVTVLATRVQESAVAYLAAHILTLADRGAAAGSSGLALVGPVSSVSTGSLSVSSGSPLVASDAVRASLGSTQYGQQVLAWLDTGPHTLGQWTEPGWI